MYISSKERTEYLASYAEVKKITVSLSYRVRSHGSASLVVKQYTSASWPQQVCYISDSLVSDVSATISDYF